MYIYMFFLLYYDTCINNNHNSYFIYLIYSSIIYIFIYFFMFYFCFDGWYGVPEQGLEGILERVPETFPESNLEILRRHAVRRH